MKKKSIPCYVNNGGVHNVVNLPLGQYARWQLKLLCKELLAHLEKLETFVAAKATQQNVTVIRGLLQILSLDLKPKGNRREAEILTTAYEKNLKPSQPLLANEEEELNLVDFAVKVSLVAILFILGGMLQYFESLNY